LPTSRTTESGGRTARHERLAADDTTDSHRVLLCNDCVIVEGLGQTAQLMVMSTFGRRQRRRSRVRSPKARAGSSGTGSLLVRSHGASCSWSPARTRFLPPAIIANRDSDSVGRELRHHWAGTAGENAAACAQRDSVKRAPLAKAQNSSVDVLEPFKRRLDCRRCRSRRLLSALLLRFARRAVCARNFGFR
jgi:hypothetical protein